MDSSQVSPHHEPQRLSALYQYHNAPEVAPAHGLEYDDTIYPSSDKYPVMREHAYDGKHMGKYAFVNDNRPPRIIFGMKLPTFLIVATIMILVVVGAAVGGAVGGHQLRENQSQTQAGYMNGSISPASTTTGALPSTSTFSAPTPTYTPLSDCPASNNTTYTSSFAQSTGASSTGLVFTKHCDLQNPLSLDGASRIAEAFVYSFSDCVDVCAAYNFYNAGSNCSVAVYQPDGSRPGNCWVGHATVTNPGKLDGQSGMDVAFLSA